MTSVVISERFGGFGLSGPATQRLTELTGEPVSECDIARDDPRLVQVVRELGRDASGGYAELVVVDLPDGVKWHIHEYDGFETVHENHRSWGSAGVEENCA